MAPGPFPGDPFQPGPLRNAVLHLFAGEPVLSQSILREHVAAHPFDPLGFSLSAALPFYSFAGNRLRTEHGNSIQSMLGGAALAMPVALQRELTGFLERARTLAAMNLEDQTSVLALCIAEGVYRDLCALVLRRWVTSLRHAQQANLQARRLLSLNPAAYDAYFVIGFSEHMLEQIPAVFRPFTKIPGIVGQTARAIQFLEAVAQSGWYFREFARQMLVTLYTEQQRPQDALCMLSGLKSDFPGNAGYRAEWARREGTQNGR
jgi:hypothetical protein